MNFQKNDKLDKVALFSTIIQFLGVKRRKMNSMSMAFGSKRPKARTDFQSRLKSVMKQGLQLVMRNIIPNSGFRESILTASQLMRSAIFNSVVITTDLFTGFKRRSMSFIFTAEMIKAVAYG